ncbi:hypothetical protein L208DRAFT_1396250 [Tricholoma matsutake]|nr:hypothetical protein L208DRAFT_1396250 [Tricholoma matsutake 945]
MSPSTCRYHSCPSLNATYTKCSPALILVPLHGHLVLSTKAFSIIPGVNRTEGSRGRGGGEQRMSQLMVVWYVNVIGGHTGAS